MRAYSLFFYCKQVLLGKGLFCCEVWECMAKATARRMGPIGFYLDHKQYAYNIRYVRMRLSVACSTVNWVSEQNAVH